MSRELPARPQLEDPSFELGMPPWLRAALRAALAGMAAALAWLSFQEWARMPTPARGLAVVIVAGLVGWVMWPGAWARTTHLLADRAGLYVPHHSQVVAVLGQPEVPRWLFLPWSRITHLRIARERGELGRGVAFDVDVRDPVQRTDFFRHVEAPADRDAGAADTVHAVYAHWPPAAVRTLRSLTRLQSGAR